MNYYMERASNANKCNIVMTTASIFTNIRFYSSTFLRLNTDCYLNVFLPNISKSEIKINAIKLL